MRQPDLLGMYGKAWHRRSPPATVDQLALLATWYVYVRSMDLEVVGWYAVSAVSLERARQVPGATRPVSEDRRATHEVHLVPIKPVRDPDGSGHRQRGEVVMSVQFSGLDDGHAAGVAEVLTRTIIKGGVEPRPSNRNQLAAVLAGVLQRVHEADGRRVEWVN